MRNNRDKERTPYKRKYAQMADVPRAQPMQATKSFYAPRNLSGTSQQAMRTGGWADPARGGELKFKDVAVTASAAALAAATFSAGELLNGTAQGSDATQRVGRKINLKSLYLRYFFQLATTSNYGGACRILIVYDKQANATAPAITDILLTDHFASANNLSNRDRFVTLVDHVCQPVGVSGNYVAADVCYRKINLETMYNSASTGAIGDITSGSVYLFFAQSGGIATAAPTLTYRCRVKYTDV